MDEEEMSVEEEDDDDDANDDTKQPQQESSRAHVCEVCVTFPTNRQAQYALEVLRVDREPTNRVTKSMEVAVVDDDDKNDNDINTATPTITDNTEEVAVLKV
jgi:Transcription factor Pcc1